MWFINLYRRNKLLLYGFGVGLMSLGAAGIGYYLWNRKNNAKKHCREPTILDEAERCKADGIESYKNRRYEEAIQIFTNAIQILKDASEQLYGNARCQELMASCENNIAACYDVLQDPVQCLVHCNAALLLNPSYVKALIKRAKCYQKLNRNAEALEDYFDLIAIENGAAGGGIGLKQQQLSEIQNETDKVADSVIKPELETLMQSRCRKPLKISQTLVSPWQFNTTINDPLLIRAINLDERSIDNTGLNNALIALKLCQYDKIPSLAIEIVENEEMEPLERAHAVLLAARFLFYQGMHDEAKAMSDCFQGFWEKLDEAQKLAHKDLHIAHIVLQMALTRCIDPNEEADDQSINEETKQRLTQLAEDALRVNPKNVDALVTLGIMLMTAENLDDAQMAFQRAKKFDKEHPYVRYYEIYAGFLVSLQQQNMARTHNQILELERALKDTEKPPIFSLLMMAKIGMMMNNTEIALEAVRKAVKIMPNCSYAIYLMGMLDQQPGDMTTPERLGPYMDRLERAMKKSLEADPNFWEPYRMLAKIRMQKHEFTEAEKLFSQAMELARSRDELMVLLKERLMVRLAAERKRKNKRLPKGLI